MLFLYLVRIVWYLVMIFGIFGKASLYWTSEPYHHPMLPCLLMNPRFSIPAGQTMLKTTVSVQHKKPDHNEYWKVLEVCLVTGDSRFKFTISWKQLWSVKSRISSHPPLPFRNSPFTRFETNLEHFMFLTLQFHFRVHTVCC